MSILDGLVKSQFSKNKKETPEERRKRLIDEGKATQSDYDRPKEAPQPVLDESWAQYAAAKAAEEEKKKKKSKAGRAVSASQSDDEFRQAKDSIPTLGSN
jgi:hypothetical protein